MDFILSPSSKGARQRGVADHVRAGRTLTLSDPRPSSVVGPVRPPSPPPFAGGGPPSPPPARGGGAGSARGSSALSPPPPPPPGSPGYAAAVGGSPRRKLASSVDFLMDRPNDSKVPVDLYRDSVVAEKNRHWRSRCWSEIWRLQDT